mgnify:FL=1
MPDVDQPWVQEYFTGPRARAAQVKGIDTETGGA